MKKSLLLKSFLALSMSVGAFGVVMYHTLNEEANEINEAKASKSSYWDSWISNNSSTISKGGKDFVSILKTKITQVADGNSNTISYDGLWSAYKTSDAVPGTNGAYIWDMYGGFKFAYQSGGKSYSVEGDCYNREHSVPKSWFSQNTPAYSDIIHLVPTDGKVNGMRSNYTFGEVSSASYTYSFPQRTDGNGDVYQLAGSSKLGTPKTINGVSSGKSTVFEPDDQYKGDFARIYMYFAVRYGGGTCQATTGDGASIFTSTCTDANPYVTNYGLALLQKWHIQDPVSTKETNRNDAIETLQGNRNPFVDYPEWADKIFGTTYEETHGSVDVGITSISKTSASLTVGDTTTINAVSSNSGTISWTSSNTSVATVSSSTASSGSNVTITGVSSGTATITASITISGTTYSKTCTVTVASASISLDKTTASIAVDGTTTLTATTSGGSGSVSWSTSNASVATVSATSGSSITVTGVSAGTATITATYSGVSATCTITVTSSGGGGGDTETYQDATMTKGTNGSDAVVKIGTDSNEAVKVGTSSKGGDMSITVPAGATKLKLYAAAWNGVTGLSLNISGATTSPSSISLTADSGIANSSPFTLSGSEDDYLFEISLNNITSETTITFTTSTAKRFVIWGAQYTTSSGSVDPETVTLSSISLNTSNVKTTFTVGETFTYSGLVVTATYSDASSKTVTPTSVSSPNMSSTGDKTVTVTYTEDNVTETTTYTITVNAATTGITATVSKTYHPGETISSSDITVTDNNGNNVTGFTFNNDGYQFTYADAPSGGSTGTKTFTNSVTYSSFTTSLTVNVSRINYTTPSTVTDIITADDLPATGTTYTDFSDVSLSSDAVYAGNSAKDGSGNIQMRSKNSNSGIVSTTSGGNITSVTITVGSGSNTIDVYGKNTAYSSASDLYTTSTQGTKVGSVSATGTVTFTTSYAYVGIRSNNGAIYISNIEIKYGSAESAVNVANYIMYQDTTNQCLTRFEPASTYFANLSKEERATFMESNDYVIATARERLLDWAKHQGKTIGYSNSDYAITNAANVGIFFNQISNQGSSIIVILLTVISSFVGGYFLLKKKDNK